MNKVSLIGPFPDPVHGMSLLNQVLNNELHKRDYNVRFFDTVLKRELKSKNRQGKFEIIYLLLALLGMTRLLLFIVKRRGGIYYFTPPQSVLGYLRFLPSFMLAKLIGESTIVHFHGSKFRLNYDAANNAYKFLIRYSFLFIDKFILLGQSIKDSHKSLLGEHKTYVCENGTAAPYTLPVQSCSKEKVNILFLSNLMKDKGILDFLSAIKKLPSDKFEVHIAGIIEPTLEDFIYQEFKIHSDLMVYHGPAYNERKAKLLVNADIFILPSYDEGQPLSILEAYSYGCSVITTDVGGIKDIFTDGFNGYTVKVGDPSSIINVLTKLDHQSIVKFKENNIATYNSRFTLDEFIARVEVILMDKCA